MDSTELQAAVRGLLDVVPGLSPLLLYRANLGALRQDSQPAGPTGSEHVAPEGPQRVAFLGQRMMSPVSVLVFPKASCSGFWSDTWTRGRTEPLTLTT